MVGSSSDGQSKQFLDAQLPEKIKAGNLYRVDKTRWLSTAHRSEKPAGGHLETPGDRPVATAIRRIESRVCVRQKGLEQAKITGHTTSSPVSDHFSPSGWRGIEERGGRAACLRLALRRSKTAEESDVERHCFHGCFAERAKEAFGGGGGLDRVAALQSRERWAIIGQVKEGRLQRHSPKRPSGPPPSPLFPTSGSLSTSARCQHLAV